MSIFADAHVSAVIRRQILNSQMKRKRINSG